MVETIATFIESLSEEETLELTRELDRRREKINLLQEQAFARLAELRAGPAHDAPPASAVAARRAGIHVVPV
jgi:hypothetical protein